MNRRNFVWVVTVGVLTTLLLAFFCVNSGSAFDVIKPNIIVILTDDQTYRGIGYNNPEVKTPNLDALAAAGITFERGYVASPICAASRASMMTGRFPQQHGVMGLGHPAFCAVPVEWRPRQAGVPSRLAEAGYLTAFFGKSHLGKPKTYGFAVGDELGGHDDVEIFKQAAEFIKSQPDAGQPFFIWLAPHQLDVPLLPEAQWLELYPKGSVHLPQNFLTAPDQRQPQQLGRSWPDPLSRFQLPEQH